MNYRSLLAILSVALMTACGDDPAPTPPGGGGGPTTGTPGGCVPLTQPQIGFTANNALYSDSQIIAGQVPNGSLGFANPVGTGAGTMTIGGGGAGGPYQRSSGDGVISMQVDTIPTTGNNVPGQFPGFGFGGYVQANLTGYVQLSQLAINDIYLEVAGPSGFGFGNPFQNPANPQNPQQNPLQNVCISGIALQGQHYNTLIYDMNVYLYLNGTQHGVILYF